MANARRNNGQGAISYDERRGIYNISVSLGVDSFGKRIRKSSTAKTKKEAEMKLREMRMLYAGGQQLTMSHPLHSIPNRILFSDLLQQYFNDPSVTSNKKGSTTQWYIYLSRALTPFIGSVYIDLIDESIITKLLIELAKRGAAESSLKRYKHLIRMLLEYAVKKGYITKNPANNVVNVKPKMISTEPAHKNIPPQIVDEVLNAISKSNVFKPIIYVLCKTGMRIGEVLSLTWNDIDFNSNLINICSTLSSDADIDENLVISNRRTIVTLPKTKSSIRVIPMSPSVRGILLEWKQFQDSNPILSKAVISPGETNIKEKIGQTLIFPNQYGKLRSYGLFQKHFNRFCKENVLDKYHIKAHDFRYTFASRLITKGVDIKTVQELLGHSNPDMVLEIYAHSDINTKRKAINILDE